MRGTKCGSSKNGAQKVVAQSMRAQNVAQGVKAQRLVWYKEQCAMYGTQSLRSKLCGHNF